MSLRKVHAVNCDCEQCADNRVLSEFFDLDGPPEIPDVEQIRQQAARECAEIVTKLHCLHLVMSNKLHYTAAEAVGNARYGAALEDARDAILLKVGIEP